MKHVALLLACSATLSAQAPIPAALREAKTVYLVNKGVHTRIMDNTAKALREWKRWTLVAEAKDADVTLTVTAQPTKQMYNWATNSSMTVNSNFFEITGPDGTPLYGAPFGNNPDKEFKKLAKLLDAQ